MFIGSINVPFFATLRVLSVPSRLLHHPVRAAFVLTLAFLVDGRAASVVEALMAGMTPYTKAMRSNALSKPIH